MDGSKVRGGVGRVQTPWSTMLRARRSRLEPLSPLRQRGARLPIVMTRAVVREERSSGHGNKGRSSWIPGSEASLGSKKLHSFLMALKKKGFEEESMTKIGLYDLVKSTALDSNKSHGHNNPRRHLRWHLVL